MKQAVVVIHGMGEQVPMETIMSFSHSVWSTDTDLIRADRPDSSTDGKRSENVIWFKPDKISRSFEFRRLATESMDGRGSTHFYEFYWANLMEGTTFEHFIAWLKDILLRAWSRVPVGLGPAWIGLWLVTICATIGFIVSLIPFEGKAWYWSVLGGVGSLLLGAAVNTFLLKYFGDVARYVKASPLNVARRQEIREKGVQLLETLMDIKADGSPAKPEYDRIIVVAHSLGTIVAYDILTHCFARINDKVTVEPAQSRLSEMEALIRRFLGLEASLPDDPQNEADKIKRFRELQWECRKELNEQGSPWIVSGFVTLGSPLTHAEFLLAFDKPALRKAQEQRIFPTCPPTLEYDGMTKNLHLSYRTEDGADKPRRPHHAALFAFTRWTNIFSPHKAILWGDIISGPVGPQFGLSIGDKAYSGIEEFSVMPEPVPAESTPKEVAPFFSHTKYWSLPPGWKIGDAVPHHISVLRRAINLKRK
ncbi:hypothetical protein [Sinorhizobium meliloti]|uniref:hypothetical protein n=1 Tax=Rhizobium meliloti TaxID=382 RepID=UPI0012AA337A|nr:hypothetical protein [Sinorhizobium meliloti]QGJ79193.1 hypothetical protein C3L21_36020 [Sinorhizobium meliloti]